MRWLTVLPDLSSGAWYTDVDMENFTASCKHPLPRWLTARAFTRFITFLEVVGD